MRRARRIFDLAPVYPALRKVPNLLGGDPVRGCAHLADERGPDLCLRLRAELAEVQRYMDAREECLVKCLNAVRRQEEDSAVILDVTQASKGRLESAFIAVYLDKRWNSQNGDHGVTFEVVQRALLEEHVRLVDEHNGLPRGRDVEDPLQRSIECSRGRAEVATADDVERAADVLARCFRGKCFPNTGWAKEVHDKTMTFALDEVVEANLLVVGLNK